MAQPRTQAPFTCGAPREEPGCEVVRGAEMPIVVSLLGS